MRADEHKEMGWTEKDGSAHKEIGDEHKEIRVNTTRAHRDEKSRKQIRVSECFKSTTMENKDQTKN